MSHHSSIRILVVHDDPVARRGLCSGFTRFADLDVSEVADVAVREAVLFPVLGAARPDVVVASHALGIAWAEGARHPGASAVKVVIVGGIDREWAIRGALERGVRGYVLGGCEFDELVACIRAVHRGARYLASQVATRLAESVSVDALTPREAEVLSLVVDGFCNKAIARQLDIAVGTVKSHLKSIFEKLHVGSRTQAVAAVERRGLLSDGQRAATRPAPVVDAPSMAVH